MKTLILGSLIVSLVLVISISKSDESLILYLPFDEGSGKEVKDFSQYEHKATIKSEPEWVKGQFGSALQFDGVDDFIEVPDNDVLHVKDALTIEMWFYKVGEWEKRYAKLTTKGGNGKGPLSWYMSQGDQEKWAFYFGVTNVEEKSESAQWNKYPPLEKWIYAAGVYDGKVTKLYLDGELKATSKLIGGDIAVNPDTLRIGWGYRAEYFNGILDEARFWSRALSQDEIKSNMKKDKKQILTVAHSQNKLTTTWGRIKTQD